MNKCKNCGHDEKHHLENIGECREYNFLLRKYICVCKQFIPSEKITTNYDKDNVKYLKEKGCGKLFGKLQTTCIESQLCPLCKPEGCGKPLKGKGIGILCGEYCKVCEVTHLHPSCSNNSPQVDSQQSGVQSPPLEDKEPESDTRKGSIMNETGSLFKLSDKIYPKPMAKRNQGKILPNSKIDVEDFAEFIRLLKEDFIEDWEFSKKAEAEPYIHFRRVIDKINKRAGSKLLNLNERGTGK